MMRRAVLFLTAIFALTFIPVVSAANSDETTIGQLLFKEDFGGNEAGVPVRALNPGWQQSGKTTYVYATRPQFVLPDVGEYALLTRSKSVSDYFNSVWAHDMSDHTLPDNPDEGYFLTFDATAEDGQFYEFDINGLSAGYLEFSIWIMNLNPTNYAPCVLPNMSIILEDNITGAEINRYNTGDILTTNSPEWQQYIFQFNLSDGIENIKCRIINNVSTDCTNGNDLAIDDIEVYFSALSNEQQDLCTFTLYGYDSYGDGWNGGHVTILQNSVQVGDYSVSGSSGTWQIPLDKNLPVEITWHGGNWAYEASFVLKNNNGATVAEMVASMAHLNNTDYSITQFIINSDCSAVCAIPKTISLDVLTTTSATLSWDTNGSEWKLFYKKTGEDIYDFIQVSDTDTCTLTGLQPNTVYNFYIQISCENSQAANSALFTFDTPPVQALAELPYFTNFSDSEENSNWALSNGLQTNKWHIDTIAKQNFDKSLYISDTDSTYHCNPLETSYVYAYRTLNFTETGTYAVGFEWKNPSDEYDELNTLRAFLVPADIPLNAGNANGMTNSTNTAPSEWIAISMPLHSRQNKWQYFNTTINIANAGLYNLVFFYKNFSYESWYYGYSDNPAAVDNIKVARQNPLAGTYTIDNALPTENKNFNSFKEALEALHFNNTSDTVIFNITAGQEHNIAATDDNPSLKLTGVGSAEKPVIFQKNGAGFNPLLKVSGTSDYQNGNDYAFLLDNVQYITLDGIDIQNAGTSDADYIENGFYFTNASNNVIKNCNIHLRQGGWNDAFHITGSSNNNNFINNNIVDAWNGYYLSSNAFNNHINGGTIDNVYTGVYTNDTQTNFTVEKTRINAVEYGIYLNEGNNQKIINNAISTNVYDGIIINSDNSNDTIFVIHNTVYMYGTDDGTCLFNNRNKLQANNNIFVNNSTNNNSYCIYGDLTNILSQSNNNLYYANGGKIFRNGSTVATTLAEYQTVLGDDREKQSYQELPPFISAEYPYNLNLRTDTVTVAESGGKLLDWVTTDIDGNPRAGTTEYAGGGMRPDIGAYEFEGKGAMFQTVCSGDFTTEVNFGSDVIFTLAEIPQHITGYVESGANILPAMQLINNAAIFDTLRYNLNSTIYTIIVRPQLPVGAFLVENIFPANDTVVTNNNINFAWQPVENAYYYDVYLWESTQNRPTQPTRTNLTVTGFTQSSNLTFGKSYYWVVVAKNNCTQIASDTLKFELRKLPNLHVSALSATEVSPEQRNFTVSYTVRNDGEGTTVEEKWNDRIWLVPDMANYAGTRQQKAILLYNDTIKQTLNAGESYTNEIEFTLPDRFFGTYWLVAATDMSDVYGINWTQASGTAPEIYQPSLSGMPYPYLFAGNYYHNEKFVLEANESAWHSDNFFYTKLIVPQPPLKPFIHAQKDTINFGNKIALFSDSVNIAVELQDLQIPLNIAVTGDDAAAFTATKLTAWTDSLGGQIKIKFLPTEIKPYQANLVLSSDTLSKSILLQGNGVMPTEYSVTAQTPNDIYASQDTIAVTGNAMYNNGMIADSVRVEVCLEVMGYRRVQQTTTDENGNYSIKFVLQFGECGHYNITAYRPAHVNYQVKDQFDIPGMKLSTNGYITWEVEKDIAQSGNIAFLNRSDILLHNIQIETIQGLPNADVQFGTIPTLNGSATVNLSYTVTGTALTTTGNWEELKLRAVSDEGIIYNFSIWFYCKPSRGALETNPAELNTLMTKGKEKIVEFDLWNYGNGETGNISVSIPQISWLTLASPSVIPSLAPEDSAKITLRLYPNEDIPLHVPFTGSIAVNCENGNSKIVPFNIQAVSESTGTLRVDVVDEYYYNTTAAPHLANAHVKITHPYSFALIAEGYTDANGIFPVENLPEGYYTLFIEADKHESYRNNILIEAGQTLSQQIFISFKAISYSWAVVPTEIEDHYEVELITKFETNVPAPVVTVDMPNKMPALQGDETYNFNITATNHGLIAALDFEATFPKDEEYEFVYLLDKFDLEAQSTQIIPVTMRRKNNGGNNPVPMMKMAKSTNTNSDCVLKVDYGWHWECGPETNYTWIPIPFTVEGRICGPGILDKIREFISQPTPCPECPTLTPPTIPTKPCPTCSPTAPTTRFIFPDIPIIQPEQSCDDDCEWKEPALDCLCKIAEAASYGLATAICEAKDAADCIQDIWENRNDVYGLTSALIGCLQDDDNCLSGMAKFVLCKLHEATTQKVPNNLLKAAQTNSNPPIVNDIDSVHQFFAYKNEFTTEYFGNETILTKNSYKKFHSATFPYFANEMPIDTKTKASILNDFQDSDITNIEIEDIINRWNTTLAAWSSGVISPNSQYSNIVDKLKLNAILQSINGLYDYAEERGFENFYEMYDNAMNEVVELVQKNDRTSVCASVSLQISQKVTMTREAFHGTLTIHNGHESIPMENVTLNLIIKDEQGNVCNNLFHIETESLHTLTEVDGTGTLVANSDGTATILFIPTINAAPTVAKTYNFGGTLSYLDPFSGETVTADLFPVGLEVHPSPNLHLYYFMQRDLFADDPMTEQIEPSVAANLGVMVQNKGYGIAKNLTIESAQPKIIDNEKGLAVNFSIIGSQLDGTERQIGLTGINFGNLNAQNTKVGHWWFTGNLLGHFTSYESHVRHLDSRGNPDLSLIDSVEIHELTRFITAYGSLDDGIQDFLVNDIPDAHDYPDAIYFSNATKTSVALAESAVTDGVVQPNNFEINLAIQSSKKGWNYVRLNDPADGKYKLIRVVRQDNQEIPLTNVWQTYCTMPDSREPVYENKLHFVDTFSVAGWVNYTLYFEEIEINPVRINSISGVPETEINSPLQNVTVHFNKPIFQPTFTWEDLSLYLESNENNRIDATVATTKIDDSTYQVDFADKTVEWGTYTLNISTKGIYDLNQYPGEMDTTVTWIQQPLLTGNPFSEYSLKVYPNPNNGKFYINIPSLAGQSAIILSNITGAIVYRENVELTGIKEINVYLPSGVYILEIRNENIPNGRLMKKMIVEKEHLF